MFFRCGSNSYPCRWISEWFIITDFPSILNYWPSMTNLLTYLTYIPIYPASHTFKKLVTLVTRIDVTYWIKAGGVFFSESEEWRIAVTCWCIGDGRFFCRFADCTKEMEQHPQDKIFSFWTSGPPSQRKDERILASRCLHSNWCLLDYWGQTGSATTTASI